MKWLTPDLHWVIEAKSLIFMRSHHRLWGEVGADWGQHLEPVHSWMARLFGFQPVPRAGAIGIASDALRGFSRQHGLLVCARDVGKALVVTMRVRVEDQ